MTGNRVTTVTDFISLIPGGVKLQPSRWNKAMCPVTTYGKDGQDRNPSSNFKHDDEWISLNDFGGCDARQIIEALGIDPSQLYHKSLLLGTDGHNPQDSILATEYSYRDENGTELYAVGRFHVQDGGKAFKLGKCRKEITMPNDRYFDTKCDTAIINIGGFFCHACLVGSPTTEASPDPRYCQGCFKFLLKGAEILSSGKRPAWIPKATKVEKAQEKPIPVSQVGVVNMSTSNDKKTIVDIFPPLIAIGAITIRGPKQRLLPEYLIRQLAADGMGSKAIAPKLKVDYGIAVSYKTIQRVLSGERKQRSLLREQADG